MKMRIFAPIVCSALIAASIFFVSCRKKAENAGTGEDTFKVTASFYPVHIMLMNITADVPGVELSLLAPAETGCLHDYQLTTRDMRLIEESDAIALNGAGMEDFLESALSGKEAQQIINAADGWPLLDGNPHVWVSPQGAAHQVRAIAEGLSRANPGNAQKYLDNARRYEERLAELSEEMRARLGRFAGIPIVAFHEAFAYLASELGLTLAETVAQGHGEEPSARELARIIAGIRAMPAGGNAPVLLAEADTHSSAAEIISEETGFPLFRLDTAASGPMDADSYIDTMRRNTAALEDALSGAK